jgi:hypothetical protein
MGLFGATKRELRRFRREALVGMKPKSRTGKVKNYNFGVSKADVVRYRKQARA